MTDENAATDEAPVSFYGKAGPPDFPLIEKVLEALRTFVEGELAAQSLAEGHKAATLCLHGFLASHRGEKAELRGLRDAIAIIAYRRKLRWSTTARGPYAPFVQIVYPTLGQNAYYAIANALEEVRDTPDIEAAARRITSRGGIDAMNRSRKPKVLIRRKPRRR